MIKCPKCEYEWKPRDEGIIPKVCPRCKIRLDYGKYDIINKKNY